MQNHEKTLQLIKNGKILNNRIWPSKFENVTRQEMCGIEKGSCMVKINEKSTIELVVMHVFVDRNHFFTYFIFLPWHQITKVGPSSSMRLFKFGVLIVVLKFLVHLDLTSPSMSSSIFFALDLVVDKPKTCTTSLLPCLPQYYHHYQLKWIPM